LPLAEPVEGKRQHHTRALRQAQSLFNEFQLAGRVDVSIDQNRFFFLERGNLHLFFGEVWGELFRLDGQVL
jgi:hypothetical protein